GMGQNGSVHLRNSEATLANNIIAGNADGITRGSGSTAVVKLSHNLVHDNPGFNYRNHAPERTDLSAPPQFVDAASGDFRLSAASPAVNAGDDAFYDEGDLDLAGNSRLSGASVDIGAYEFVAGGLGFSDALLALRIAGGLVAITPND